jgi:capsular polysaccharide biosynthesis protein
MTNFFDNQNLLDALWKWKKHLIVVGILAIVFSAFFSSSIFIKPKYKSTARIYPSNNIFTFSDESQSEQLLEIISSLDIKFRVIDVFDLSSVYKISKKEPQYLSNMMSEFNDNVSFKKTEYETVEIQVLDTDPKRACTMCDSIISFLDQKIRSMHRIKYQEVADIIKKDIRLVTHQSDSVLEKLNLIRKDYNILDYELQVKEVTKGMVKVLTDQKTNTTGGKEIEQWMKNLAEKGGEYESLYTSQKKLVSQIDSLKKEYNQSMSSATKKIIYGQRVQNPVPADKKSYPLRSLIVFISTFAALFAAILVILFLENKNKV